LGNQTTKPAESYKTSSRKTTSIDCGLGGGNNGYLGVLLLAAEYATIPGTVQFIAPVNPGHTAPPVAGAAAAIANQARVCKETTTNNHAIFDSGTTRHYILLDMDCIDKKLTMKPIVVTLPNGQHY
jgi:hypothetical protein